MSESESVALRLAIALIVLKHKPKQQSIPGYLLDLQSQFPLPGDSHSSSVNHASWRNRALTLERELECLKQKHEEDQEELTRLRQNAPKDLVTGPQKKKSKKTGMVPAPRVDEWATEQTNSCNADGQLPQSITAVFTTLRSVVGSTSLQTSDRAAGHSRLPSVTTRSLLAIKSFLGLHNLSGSSLPYSELNSSKIAMVSPFLVYVLRVAFPALFRQGISSAISTAMSCLIDTILVPLVRSFAPASNMYIAHHIDAASAKKTSKGRTKAQDKMPQSHSQKPISDVRMDILTLLTEALDTLGSSSSAYFIHTAGIRERIALEAVRALESLYSTVTTVGENGSADRCEVQGEASGGMEPSHEACPSRKRTALSRQERLATLARKDATWYLCHILNSCAGRSVTKDGLGASLSNALLDGAAILVKICISMDCDSAMRVQRGSVMDMMCRNMILAACENIIVTPQEMS